MGLIEEVLEDPSQREEDSIYKVRLLTSEIAHHDYKIQEVAASDISVLRDIRQPATWTLSMTDAPAQEGQSMANYVLDELGLMQPNEGRGFLCSMTSSAGSNQIPATSSRKMRRSLTAITELADLASRSKKCGY